MAEEIIIGAAVAAAKKGVEMISKKDAKIDWNDMKETLGITWAHNKVKKLIFILMKFKKRKEHLENLKLLAQLAVNLNTELRDVEAYNAVVKKLPIDIRGLLGIIPKYQVKDYSPKIGKMRR